MSYFIEYIVIIKVYFIDVYYVKYSKLSIKINKVLQNLNNLVNFFYDRFFKEISFGLVEVILFFESYYFDLINLKETFGDFKERVR